MEFEYTDPGRRNRLVVMVGLVLAVVVAAGVFLAMNQLQQQAVQREPEQVSVVVAARTIVARKPIEEGDLKVARVPVGALPADGMLDDPSKLYGRVLAVTVFENQPVTTNLLASTSSGGQFSILGPEETVGPDSEYWRAVSLTVPDDRAVGGLLQAGQTVDVVATATVLVPQEVLDEGVYYVDKSSKVTYQDVLILARVGSAYVVKATLVVAEEISHLQAAGNVQFSMVLRPEVDVRIADASRLGTTTNRFLERYGLPIPEVYPVVGEPLPTLPPVEPPSPSPEPSESPSPSP